jgi:hypothetical protein
MTPNPKTWAGFPPDSENSDRDVGGKLWPARYKNSKPVHAVTERRHERDSDLAPNQKNQRQLQKPDPDAQHTGRQLKTK